MTGDDESLNSINQVNENPDESPRIPDGINDVISSISDDPIPIVELPWEVVSIPPTPERFYRASCPNCDMKHVRPITDPPAYDKLVHCCFALDKRLKKRNG